MRIIVLVRTETLDRKQSSPAWEKLPYYLSRPPSNRIVPPTKENDAKCNNEKNSPPTGWSAEADPNRNSN